MNKDKNAITESLFSIMDAIRGNVDNNDSKVITHQMFALKYLCLNRQHTITVTDEVRWERIAGSGIHIRDKVITAFSQIEQANSSLKGVFDKKYVTAFDEDALFKLVVAIDKYGPGTNDMNDRDLVAKYTEELMRMYMKNDGKRGDLYTPDELGTLVVQLLQPKEGTVYDGSTGIGDLLVKVKEYNNKVTLFGQEVNYESWLLAKINFVLHGYSTDEADIKLGNTLTNPLWLENLELKKFDYGVMNPPFGLKNWGAEQVDQDTYRRFDYGIPGRAHGDIAFISHFIASLNEGGKGAIIVPHGVLFRGGLEQRVRQAIVNDDLLEAIISLPSNLFYGTGIPVLILLFNRKKATERKGYVQFINAESGFEKRRTINILREKDIQKILNAYHNMEEVELLSRLVPIDVIHKNGDRWTPNLYFQKVKVNTQIGTFHVDRKEYEEHPHERVKLEEIAEVYRGINPPSKKSGEGDKIKYIQLKDIHDGQILFKQLDEMVVDDRERALAYKVQQGDIILSSRGTALKMAIVPEHKGDILLSNMFLGIRVHDPNKAFSRYIQSFFESPVGIQYLESYQSGSVATVLSYKDVEKILIPLFPYQKQVEIADGIVQAELEYFQMIEEAKQVYKDKMKEYYDEMTILDSIEGF